MSNRTVAAIVGEIHRSREPAADDDRHQKKRDQRGLVVNASIVFMRRLHRKGEGRCCEERRKTIMEAAKESRVLQCDGGDEAVGWWCC